MMNFLWGVVSTVVVMAVAISYAVRQPAQYRPWRRVGK